MKSLSWKEVTPQQRPPQDKLFLWAAYIPVAEEGGLILYEFATLTSGWYRFGVVEGPGGIGFTLPGQELRPMGKRVFWAEVNLPEEGDLL